MTLKDCYAAMGGNYEDAIGRLRSERLVQKFVLKFLDDGSYDLLCRSLEEKNYLNSYESPANGKLRKYYSITKDGRKYLKSRKEEWQEYQEAVLNVLWVGLACEC